MFMIEISIAFVGFKGKNKICLKNAGKKNLTFLKRNIFKINTSEKLYTHCSKL